MFVEQQKRVCVWIAFVACGVAPGRSAASQDVTLPLDDYEALRKRAEPRDVLTPPPSVPVALESAELELVVGRKSAQLSVGMNVTIYDDRWQTIALPADGSLTSVELGTLEGRVTSESTEGGSSERVLVCRGLGRHDIRFEAVISVQEDVLAARPTRTVAFALPLAGIVTGVVRSDADSDEIVLTKGALERGVDAQGGRSFVGAPGSELRVEHLGESDLSDSAGLPLVFEASSAATHVELPKRMAVLNVQTVNDAELEWPSAGRVSSWTSARCGRRSCDTGGDCCYLRRCATAM